MSALDIKIKKEIYQDWLQTQNKTQTALSFGVSPRTVGRCVAMFAEKIEDITAPPVQEEVGPYPYMITNESITVYIDDDPRTVSTDSDNAAELVRALVSGDFAKVKSLVYIGQSIAKFSMGNIEFDGSGLTYKGWAVDNSLTKYLIDSLNKGVNMDKYVKFLDNLMENPSSDAVNEIYDFVTNADLPITDDGYILAYKKVRENYTDCYTGKFDNSVGQVLEMPRFMVDPVRTNHCSQGFHFCSENYLKSFGGQRIMVVKINPADVVSIPDDYDFAKGRCWKYEVVGELKPNERLSIDGVVLVG